MNNTSFTERVHEVVKSIPKGSVMTYKGVAKAAGNPNAYRAVGTILAKNYDSTIPCHRVINSDGSLGSYNRGKAKKRTLLIEEGAIRG